MDIDEYTWIYTYRYNPYKTIHGNAMQQLPFREEVEQI